ncbi:hypothetical protein O3P69_020103 [Scylla paramamosain]|uniref:Uncharacterized protein n=1 Tax=Scylla paramamosain TaxID=85552 RepID=A0AAW0TLK8_SCYPA
MKDTGVHCLAGWIRLLPPVMLRTCRRDGVTSSFIVDSDKTQNPTNPDRQPLGNVLRARLPHSSPSLSRPALA